MESKYLGTLVSTFVAVTMAVCGLGLYFTLEFDMRHHSQGLLAILACGFLYWAIFWWDKLQLHISRMKDKEWLKCDARRKQLLREIKEDARTLRYEQKVERKRRKIERKRILQELRDER